MQKATTLQKKLIVVALATTAFSAPAFADNANVTIYGAADMSYDYIGTGNGVSTANGAVARTGVSKSNVSSNVSKLGLKGSEDLGGGLAAVWQIEQQINIDNSTTNANSFATRNSFVGLKNDGMGTVLLGRHDTPYKLATRKLDAFGDSIADNRSLLGGVGSKSAVAAFDGRQGDVIAYITPAMSGFTGAIAYVNLSETNTLSTESKVNAVSVAGMYDAAPFYASLGYESHKIGAGTLKVALGPLAANSAQVGATESAWKLGFGYTIDAFTLGFAYEKSSDDAGAARANLFGHNAYYLSGNYKMGMDAVKFAYGKAGQVGAVANSGANQFSLGYDHGLSKRTKLYAIYSRINNGNGINYGFSQSTAAATSVSSFGADPSVISLGVKHTF